MYGEILSDRQDDWPQQLRIIDTTRLSITKGRAMYCRPALRGASCFGRTFHRIWHTLFSTAFHSGIPI